MESKPSSNIVYMVIIFWAVFAGCVGLRAAGASLWACLDLALLVILAGYVLDSLRRDLHTATLNRKARDYAKAIFYAERFLSRLKWLRWLKPLIRARSGSPRDPEAMALNCLGGAQTSQGKFATARVHLEAAIKLDPQWALPYFGMGVLTLRTQGAAAAKPWFETARQYGFSHSSTDPIITDPEQFELDAINNRLTGELEKWTASDLPPASDAEASVPAAGTSSVTVQILNDDKTPMEFVVVALETVFGLPREAAVKLMLEVHRTGRGNCGTYASDEAAAKISELHRRARARGFALECTTVPPAPL